MEKMTKHHSPESWDDLISTSKNASRFISKAYGLTLPNHIQKQGDAQNFVNKKQTLAEKNIESITNILQCLYTSKSFNLLIAKKHLSEILDTSFIARDKLSLNKKIINLLTYHTESHGKEKLSDKDKIFYYKIIRFYTFASSSKLEGVNVTYVKIGPKKNNIRKDIKCQNIA